MKLVRKTAPTNNIADTHVLTSVADFTLARLGRAALNVRVRHNGALAAAATATSFAPRHPATTRWPDHELRIDVVRPQIERQITSINALGTHY